MTDAHDDQPDTQAGDALSADSGERYRRGERIASGGMGEVWRARDTVLGREVAVKVLKREFADDATFRARFAAEARHAAGLHHPGIASVFDYGILQEGNAPYLVMELVDGKPLSELLAQGQPFDAEQARLLALQVAEALAAAHEAGVVHRDVKPANLLVTPDGRVKITDFGIARATGSVAFTQTGQIVGTPQYLSPEQARGESATEASDVYALGVVLFECLSGRRPFVGDTPIATALAQIHQPVPSLPDHVPPALAEVVGHALAKDPAERYADGAAIAAALRGAADGAVPVAVPIATPAADHTQVLAATPPVAAAATVEPPRAPLAEGPAPRRPRAARWPLLAAGLLALAVIAALLVAHPWARDTGAGTGTSVAGADTVRVPKAYLGEPVEDVVAALRKKGLETRVETRENPGDRDVDTVADLDPTGKVEKGATITIGAWGQPPAAEPTDQADNGDKGDRGDRGDRGDDSSGKGDGNGKGNDQTQPADPQTSEPTDSPSPSADPGMAGAAEPGQADKKVRPEKVAESGTPTEGKPKPKPTKQGD
ncbi:MAG: pknA [Marmoricola sp.]|nr:pknA [Marmoricola sp.]MCW2837346.1 pknA [Marmoricola sp.]